MDKIAVVYVLELIQSVTNLYSIISDALSCKMLQELHPLYLAEDLRSTCVQLLLLRYDLGWHKLILTALCILNICFQAIKLFLDTLFIA